MPTGGTNLNPRQAEIVQRVEANGFATIETLMREFGVSAQTIRRDIIQLDKQGILRRFHGGAGLPRDNERLEYQQKKSVSVEGKHHIGAGVAGMIGDGAAVFLDVGTTVEAVAHELTHRHDLSVFTNSLASAMALAGSRLSNVVVTGGLIHGADGSLIGDTAIDAIRNYRFDVAVIGCSGFGDDGAVMDFDLHKVGVKKAAMANARRVILAADHSKFSRTAFVRIAPLEDFSDLVTDTAPPAALGSALMAAGVDLVVV
ncbi:MAG: DeoR/GlpR transcriptional regulator [Hyphomicrobiales bacterium]|nr:MAG: DeoR/GlpR transcriptional regulator [Hyphomicrobiales bacterium]